MLLAEKEKAYQSQLEQKEKDLAEQLLRQKEELEREKEEQEKHLMELLQDKLRDKEKDLSDQLEQQKVILIAEKEKVENDLMEEMNRKIEEKDKELTTQLKTQRDRLENILQLKIDEQMRLQVKPVPFGRSCSTVLPHLCNQLMSKLFSNLSLSFNFALRNISFPLRAPGLCVFTI